MANGEAHVRGMANLSGRTMNSADEHRACRSSCTSSCETSLGRRESPFPTCRRALSSRRAFGSTRKTRRLMPSRQS